MFCCNTEAQIAAEKGSRRPNDDDEEEDKSLVQDRFNSDDLKLPDQQLAKKRGLEQNSLGLRYPIWFAACRFEDFSYKLTCAGDHKRGTDFLLLQSLGEEDSWANIRLNHPELRPLAECIVKYLRNFHSDENDIPVIHARPVNLCTYGIHTVCVLYLCCFLHL